MKLATARARFHFFVNWAGTELDKRLRLGIVVCKATDFKKKLNRLDLS